MKTYTPTTKTDLLCQKYLGELPKENLVCFISLLWGACCILRTSIHIRHVLLAFLNSEEQEAVNHVFEKLDAIAKEVLEKEQST